jgi:hypothetical protein
MDEDNDNYTNRIVRCRNAGGDANITSTCVNIPYSITLITLSIIMPHNNMI